jgi:23S rRNA pseudouridine2605 synthase
MGLGSRREAEGWIRAGRLTVNGKPAELGMRVLPAHQIRLDKRLLHQRPARGGTVFACHRSPGEPLLGGTAETGLVERLPRRSGKRYLPVSPMPRVDGGIELVSADGDLVSALQRAVARLQSEFSVRIRGELDAGQLERVLSGVLDSGAAVGVERCEAGGGEGANRWYSLVARGASGKDVRQLFERQGAQVSRVLRTRFGTVTLDRSVARGQFRELTPTELEALTAPPPDSQSSGP